MKKKRSVDLLSQGCLCWSRKSMRRLAWVNTFLLIFLSLQPLVLQAAPSGGTVVPGSGTVVISTPDAVTTEINQATDKAIINWDDFSIDAGELVRFLQPGADSVTLNRVIGSLPSDILGQLTANGRIFLLNPNGILFGAGSQIDVAGLMAGTFNITDADFLDDDDYTFAQDPGKSGSYVVNRGTINIADNGFVYLVAPGVANSGVIVANLGQVMLGSGSAFTMSFDAGGLISYDISGQVAEAINGPGGVPLTAAVSNSGLITSTGGQVLLTGDTARAVMATAVNNSGIIEAKSIVGTEGDVRLESRAGGDVANSGAINASAAAAGAGGGSIEIASAENAVIGGALTAGEGTTPGKITVTAADDVTVATNLTVAGTDADLDVQAGGAVQINAALSAGSSTVTIDAAGTISNGAAAGVTNITAGTINLTTSESGATIGEEGKALLIDAGTLNAQTNSGHIILKDVAGGVEVGTISTWSGAGDVTGTVILEAMGGAITAAALPGNNITAYAATLSTTVDTKGTVDTSDDLHGGAIGNAGASLTTDIVVLTAETENGSIFVSEESGVIINYLNARENGLTTIKNDLGKVVIDSAGTVGNNGVTLVAGGDILLGSVSAPGTVDIATGGSIYDSREHETDVIARTLNLAAGGSIGHEFDPLESMVETINADAANGGIYITDAAGVTIGTITASGAANDIVVTSNTGDLHIGTVSGGTVTLESKQGKLTDNNGAADNIIAGRAVLRAATGIGGSAAGAEIDTNVVELDAAVSGASAPIFIKELDGLTALTLSTNNGNVTVNLAGGPLTFMAASSLLTLAPTPGMNLSFTNTGGNIVQQGINVGAADLILNAAGFIGNSGAASLTAEKVTLTAGSYIGVDGNAIATNANELILTSANGGIYISEADAVTLTAAAGGAGSRIKVSNAAGDMTLKRVAAPGEIYLQTAGSLLDGNGNDVNISGASALLDAGQSIGTAGDALESSIGALDVTSHNGGIFLANSGNLSNLDASAAAGDISISSTGNMTLGQVLASGRAVTLTAGGDILDGNGDTVNITAIHANLKGRKIGTSTDKIEIAVDELVVESTNGGIFIYQPGSGDLKLISAKAGGSGSDVDIAARKNILLGTVQAAGNNVILASEEGAITDGRNAGESLPNVRAKSLEISAPGGLGTAADPLAFDVSFLSADGGATGVAAVNLGPLAITADSLTGKGASVVTIVADKITILDNGGATIDMDNGGSLTLIANTGDIVFLNQDDTIDVSGGGSILLQAGWASPGSGAVIIAGNLITSGGGSITLQADSHITIGRLDAGYGAGAVHVESRNGIILDGNGADTNIIAGTATLIGRTPTADEAELIREQATAEYYAALAEAAAKLTNMESWEVYSLMMSAMALQADISQQLAAANYDAAAAAFNSADATLQAMYITLTTLQGVKTGLQIAADVAALIAAGAQAIPLTGDGGASLVAEGVDVAFSVADMALFAFQVGYDQYENTVAGLENDMNAAAANLWAATQNQGLTSQMDAAAQAALAVAQAAYADAVIAGDHADMVNQQAIAAAQQNNVIGSATQPLGIEATNLNIMTYNQSNVYLESPGNLGLGNITAAGAGAQVIANAVGNISIIGTVDADSLIRVESSGGGILDGGGLLIAPELLLLAENGIGGLTGIAAKTERLAADGGNGGVYIRNSNGDVPLYITTVDGIAGISGAGDITINTTGDMVLQDAITDTSGINDILLTSTGGAIIDGNGLSANVIGNTLTADAATGIELDSRIAQLTASTGAGDILIREQDGILLSQLTALTGNVNVAAGGLMRVSVITAGEDIALEAAGAIEDDLNNGTRITGDALILTAGSGIGSGGPAGTTSLDTDVNSLTATVTGSGAINISEANGLDMLQAVTPAGDITITAAAGDMKLDSVSAEAAGNTVTLIAAGGAISDALADEDADISAANLAISAASGIGSGANGLEITVDNIVGDGGSGGIYITDLAGGLIVGGVTPGLGNQDIIGLSAIGGDIEVTALSPITINEAVTGAGNIIFTAGSSGAADDITINAGISSIGTTGGIALNAADAIYQNADLTLAGDGDITVTATAGSITMLADAATTVGGTGNIALNAGTDITLGDRAALGTGTGDIDLLAGNDIILGNYTSANVAGAGNISLTATAGSISLGTGTDAGIGTDGNIILAAGQNIGLGEDASATVGGHGNISFAANAGSINLGTLVNVGIAGNGNIDLYAGSNVTQGMGATTGVSGDGNITVTADTGSIAMLADAATTVGGTGNIALNAGTDVFIGDDADISIAGDGNITLLAGNDIIAEQDAAVEVAGSGNIGLTATAGSILLGLNGIVTVGTDGAVAMMAGTDIGLGDNSTVGVYGSGTLELAAGNDISMGSNALAGVQTDGNVTMTAGGNIGIGSLSTVGTQGSGDVSLTAGNSITAGPAAEIGVGVDGNIALTTLTDDGTPGSGDITLLAGTGVGVGGIGNITFNAAGELLLGNGAIVGTGSGDILFGAGDSISIADNANVGIAGDGNLAMTAEEDINIEENANVGIGGNGNIDLHAGGNVTQGTAATIAVAGDGDITATATAGSITMLANAVTKVGGAGSIYYDAYNNIVMGAGTLVETSSGDISFLADGSIIANRIAALAGDVYLTATSGPITSADTAVINVTADNLTAIAGTGIGSAVAALQTAVTAFTGRTTAAGPIVINELDGIELTDVRTANGAITITAGGSIDAVNILSLTDLEDNDITLTATGGGSIRIDNINAGQNSGDIILTAATGSGAITTNTGGQVAGDELTAAAVSGINLTTALNSIAAGVSGTGDLLINEADDIHLTDIWTADGYITVMAGNGITAERVESITDADDNDITLTANNGDVIVELVKAGNGAMADVSITAGGAILRAGSGSDLNIIGDHISLNALTGIGDGAEGPLQIAAVSLVARTNSGDINLVESDGIIVEDAQTLDGSIILITEAAGSGDSWLNSMTAGSGSLVDPGAQALNNGNIIVLSQGAGTIIAGSLTASGDVELATDGAIYDDNDNDTLITANLLTLRAGSGIGSFGAEATRALDSNANTLSARLSDGGAINIAEADGLQITQAVTPDGDITITAADGDLSIAGNIIAGAAGNTITLIANGGAIGALAEAVIPAVSATNLGIAASEGIGSAAAPLQVAVDNLAADGGIGGIYISDGSCGLNIGDVTPGLGLADINGLRASGGNIAIASRGTLTVNEVIINTGDGNILLGNEYCGGNGNIVVNADITGAGGSILLNAAGSVEQNADLATVGQGDIMVIAGDGSIVMAPGTSSRVQFGNIHYIADGDLTLSDLLTEIGGSGGAVILNAGGTITESDDTAGILANFIVINSPAPEEYLFNLAGRLIGDSLPYQIVINGRVVGGSVIDSNALLPLFAEADALDIAGNSQLSQALWQMLITGELIDPELLYSFDEQGKVWYVGQELSNSQDQSDSQAQAGECEVRAAETSGEIPDAA